ncbi:MAG: sulfatase-like hydrolase/transferase, partial [Polyangiaceae bacterium]
MRRFFLFLRDVGAVLGGWGLLLAAEHLAVGIGYRRLFVASWEMGLARTLVTPVALAALLPLAVVLALAKPLFSRVDEDGRARLLAASTLAWLAGWAALDCSHGRHFADPKLRAGFIAGAALVALAGGYVLAGPIACARAGTRAVVGFAFAAAFWCADAFVLPRLYPGFHALSFVLVLLSGALVGTWIAGSRIVSAIFLLAALVSCAWAPHAVKKLATFDNLRIVLLEHAPILGRAVELAAAVAPPPLLDDDGSAVTSAQPTARQLDWTGDDIVLLTVDALRADHLGVYGSARATSPHIDELAAHGVVFDAAYCPTPHTSYSITSLMTGKYMRPLLALGLGEDSETWASIMRKYSYKTAAFYPPAVFFIDEERFPRFERESLGFEYAKVEFADPALRETQVAGYLATAPKDKPLFLWVHFFEPHEPYVAHPTHPFGDSDLDRYDSEIAAADEGIGAVVREVRASRPGAIVIATADHG